MKPLFQQSESSSTLRRLFPFFQQVAPNGRREEQAYRATFDGGQPAWTQNDQIRLKRRRCANWVLRSTQRGLPDQRFLGACRCPSFSAPSNATPRRPEGRLLDIP